MASKCRWIYSHCLSFTAVPFAVMCSGANCPLKWNKFQSHKWEKYSWKALFLSLASCKSQGICQRWSPSRLREGLQMVESDNQTDESSSGLTELFTRNCNITLEWKFGPSAQASVFDCVRVFQAWQVIVNHEGALVQNWFSRDSTMVRKGIRRNTH